MNDRVVIAIEGNEVIEKVAEHFGRCTKFKVCEFNEDKTLFKTEIYFNPLVGEHNGSCQLPGYVKQFNVKTIIAGGMGQKAISNFLSNGINVITAPGLEFKKALKLFVEGKLNGYNICNQELNHH